jgi:hypothetical protein
VPQLQVVAVLARLRDGGELAAWGAQPGAWVPFYRGGAGGEVPDEGL